MPDLRLSSKLAILFVALTLTSFAYAQRGFLTGTGEGLKSPVDLTSTLEASCVGRSREVVGSGVILDVRYDKHSAQLIRKVLDRLKPAVRRTFDILGYSDEIILTIYVAKVRKVPAGFEVKAPAGSSLVYPIVYDGSSDLSLDCDQITKLCEVVYTTIPHELTHSVLEGFIDANAIWIEEGLAEYVSGIVASELSPRQVFKREMETLPEVSLDSEPIRTQLLSWTYRAETLTAESVLFYGAAHQIVRLIVASNEKESAEAKFLRLISELRRTGRRLRSDEVVDLVKQRFDVDVRQIGALSAARRAEILAAAISTYRRERNNPKTGYRYSSLVTFAHLKGDLPDEILLAIVEEAFNTKNDALFRRLAAKALLSRMDAQTFTRVSTSSRFRRTEAKKFTSVSALEASLRTLAKP